jgi:hypothetical protein
MRRFVVFRRAGKRARGRNGDGFEPGNFTATFTYTDTHGNKLTGTNHSPGVMPDPTPPHTVGHVNRFPGRNDTCTAVPASSGA